jgi:ribosomal protein L11 methyltransferase
MAGRFVIHGAHDRARVAPNRIGIEIEAALAFGTGHHGTTSGCLLALDALLRTRRPEPIPPHARGRDKKWRVLDIGTGTGILAIAAARALRTRVLASDNDIAAVRVARENARSNRVGALAEIFTAAGAQTRRLRERAPYDLVLANILLGPLKLMAAPAARLLAPGGRIVLSGLLPAHANAAIAAYRMQRLVVERRIVLDGWVTLVMRRLTRRKVSRRNAR